MCELHRYSWHEPKDPRSSELLDVIPTAATFRAIGKRAAMLSLGVRHEDGSFRSDRSQDMLGELADCCERIGRFDEAIEVRAEILERLENGDGGELTFRSAAAIEYARLKCRLGDTGDARSMLEVELGRVESLPSPERVSDLLTALALAELADGKILSSLDRLDRAFATARKFSLTAAKGHALSAVGAAYTMHESYNDAVDILNRASLLHQRVGNRGALAKVYNNMGVTYYARECSIEAIPLLELGADFSSDKQDLLTTIGSLNNIIRATEMRSLEPRAHFFRERAEELIADLPSLDIGRVRDRTMLRVGHRLTEDGATYRSHPFIGEAVVLLAPYDHTAVADLPRNDGSESDALHDVEISTGSDDIDDVPGTASQ